MNSAGSIFISIVLLIAGYLAMFFMAKLTIRRQSTLYAVTTICISVLVVVAAVVILKDMIYKI